MLQTENNSLQKEFPYHAAVADSGGVIFWCENGEVRKIPTHGGVFDIYKGPDDTLVYSSIHDSVDGQSASGLVIADRNGDVLRRYTTKNEVFGVYPFADGYLVGELTGKCVTVLDRDLSVVRTVPVKYDAENMHEVMRGVSIAKDGNIWVVQPGELVIRKYSFTGEVLEEIPTGPDTFGMEELENGNIIYTQHHAICEIDRQGNEIWRVNTEDIPKAGLCWALNFKLLENGHILLVNWLGHGCEGKGYPVMELDENHALCAVYPISPDAHYVSDLALL